MKITASCFVLWAVLCVLSQRAFGADSSILFEPSSQIPAEGGPAAKLAYLPGGTAFLTGGIGAISVSHNVGIGVGGYSLDSDYEPVHDGIRHDIGYTYGGLYLDYSLVRFRFAFITLSFLAGPAQGWSVARTPGAERVYANFAQIEPGINLMISVTHELRIGLGGSYRFCAGDDLDGDLGADLQGGALTLTMMYGKID